MYILLFMMDVYRLVLVSGRAEQYLNIIESGNVFDKSQMSHNIPIQMILLRFKGMCIFNRDHRKDHIIIIFRFFSEN